MRLRSAARCCFSFFISIHAPLAGCDGAALTSSMSSGNFNPRTPCGVRRLCHAPCEGAHLFQSTHPLRGATEAGPIGPIPVEFQSTHPLRGATFSSSQKRASILISIHAPLAGCDRPTSRPSCWRSYFNPRTPCGVRPFLLLGGSDVLSFQSTHPLRGATRVSSGCDGALRDFNPRTPCGVRHVCACAAPAAVYFNPRTPCGVRPPRRGQPVRAGCHFNPRTPCGVRRLAAPALDAEKQDFNPRTPCGVRPSASYTSSRVLDFNPRTPCGVRLDVLDCGKQHIQFQSTHPLRGATRMSSAAVSIRCISIHAPLAGCDLVGGVRVVDREDFNPRTPCGVRRVRECAARVNLRISIHAPLAGCDRRTRAAEQGDAGFQSTHPLRGATPLYPLTRWRPLNFNPRTPCGVRPMALAP